MLTFGVKKIVTVCSGKAFRCTSPRVLCVARCSGDPLSVEGLYCFVVQIFKNLKANASHKFVGRVCSYFSHRRVPRTPSSQPFAAPTEKRYVPTHLF
jgi:hypothetical protein